MPLESVVSAARSVSGFVQGSDREKKGRGHYFGPALSLVLYLLVTAARSFRPNRC